MTTAPCPFESEAMRLGAHELGPELQAHAEACARCAAHVEANRELSELASRLPWDAPAPDRVEQLRTKLLAEAPRGKLQVPSPEPSARATRRRAYLGAVAAAAAVMLLWLGLRGQPAASAGVPRVALRPAAGAVYTDLDTSPDRIVRLTEGSLLIEVEKLNPEQRVRVVTGDAEVEVRGTSFDVVAAKDRLVSVWVLHGKVEVRPRRAAPVLLAQGERWEAVPETAKAPATIGQGATTQPSAVAQPAMTTTEAATRPAPPHATSDQRTAARSVPSRNTPAQSAPPMDDPSEAAFREGWKALKSGNTAAAESAFARAEKAPTSAVSEDARFWRAVALSRAGKNSEAIAAFRAFIAAHPHSARRGEASTLLGRLLLESGQHAAARERFLDAQHDARPEVKRAAESGLADSKDSASQKQK